MQEAQKALSKALSVDGAAAFTGLSKNYIYRLIYLKKIPHYKPMGGRVFFKQEELEKFIFRNRQGVDYEVESHA
ncbi:MAG: helix-turn-helix domain-containing protein [Treponema sp.]|jgi:excisionase family DNA binding protein|nr:helix-turn-helix domain-containing protein [Treponema sp.]